MEICLEKHFEHKKLKPPSFLQRMISCHRWWKRHNVFPLIKQRVCFSEVQRFKPSHNPRINTLRLEKCGNLAHGDDATGRQPLLAARRSPLAAPIASVWGDKARRRSFALLPSICVCVGMSCLLLWLETFSTSTSRSSTTKQKKELQNKHQRSSEGEGESSTLFGTKAGDQRTAARAAKRSLDQKFTQVERLRWAASLLVLMLMFHFRGSAFFYHLPPSTKTLCFCKYGPPTNTSDLINSQTNTGIIHFSK